MGKFIDLTGQRFGQLVVESFAEIKNKKTYWNCICDCGNKTVVRSDQLRSGMTKSCGCYNVFVVNKRRIDLTEKRFGKLVAKSYAGHKNHATMWNCVCDCGNECEVPSSHLLNGYKKSCGCIKEEYDLSGKRFGSWTVLCKGTSKHSASYWHCRCDCGVEREVSYSSLVNGKSKSCGCYHSEVIGKLRRTHGMSNTRLFNIFHNMKRRCYDSNSTGYIDYGGRGITVCDEWLGEHGFEKFVDWALANGYKENLTLDRKNTNGNYQPSNCRWTTSEQQGNNKRTNHLITYNNETHTVTEWSKIIGIKRETIYGRIRYGWKEEQLFTPPKTERRKK